MLIDIKSITRSIGAVLTIETETSPEELSCSFQGYRLIHPLVFQGSLQNSGEGVMRLTGRIRTAYTGECARCLVPVKIDVDLPLTESYRLSAADERDDSYFYAGSVLDISQAIRDTLILAMPQRLFCRGDCQGLCPVCGANRNEADCGHVSGPEYAKPGLGQPHNLLD